MTDALGTIAAVAGVLGGVGGVWAAVLAHAARSEARRSVKAAEVSADAAAVSVEIARAERARATERTDVHWIREVIEDRPGYVAVRNAGSTAAHSVRALVTINGEGFELGPIDVPPLGYVTLDAGVIYVPLQEAATEMWRRSLEYGFVGTPRTEFDVRIRLTWLSELGTPERQVIGDD